MRRLPPERIDTSLGELVDLVPGLCEDLLSSIDQPLKIARDNLVGKEYLLCDYNRDGDSYRCAPLSLVNDSRVMSDVFAFFVLILNGNNRFHFRIRSPDLLGAIGTILR